MYISQCEEMFIDIRQDVDFTIRIRIKTCSANVRYM